MPAEDREGARRAAQAVLDRRRAERAERIGLARSLVSSLAPELDVRAVVVVAWTPDELARQLARNNPIAVEVQRCGVWLAGSLAEVVR